MKKIIDMIEKIQLIIGGICLTIFFVTVLIQIITRYLEIPVIWTEDVSMYAFIWSIFMGASAMVNEKEHFAFTILSSKLKGNSKICLQIIISTIMLMFTLAMLYYGMQIVEKFWNYSWISIPQFKMGYVWLCLPITGITCSIYLISHIFEGVNSIFKKGVV